MLVVEHRLDDPGSKILMPRRNEAVFVAAGEFE